MHKIVFTSDLHIGITNLGINRTEEIFRILLDILKHCIKLKNEGHEVTYIIGGDIFDRNDPTEHHIALFIKYLNIILKHQIKTYIMVGNHDAVNDPERNSCLKFIERLSQGPYKCIKLIDDIKCIEYLLTDYGHLFLTFLPHISKSLCQSKNLSPQDYLTKKIKQIQNKVGLGDYNLVFSHLNIHNANPGTENDLLKKSHVYLPDLIINDRHFRGGVKPIIISGHIHSNAVIDNINIIGSPFFVDFGEKDLAKYFAEITFGINFDQTPTIQLHRTRCYKMQQFKLDLIGEKSVRIGHILNAIDKESIVKIIPIVDETFSYDWNKLYKRLSLRCHYLYPIKPKILKKRTVRDERQTSKLSPYDACKLWIENNKPPSENILKRIQQYLEQIKG